MEDVEAAFLEAEVHIEDGGAGMGVLGKRLLLTMAALGAGAWLATAGCGGEASGAESVKIGDAGVLDGHTSQADIEDGALTPEEIAARGEFLFTASFNTLDGAGRPETTDVNPNNFRPARSFPDNFNRISGPDANSCSSCHSLPRLGGGGDNATNVFILADRFHFVNFDEGEGDGFETHTLRSVGNERTSLGLFGSGYIELLAREMTEELHAIRDSARREARSRNSAVTAALFAKGVDFGTITAQPDGSILTGGIEGVDADLVIRPFMQKGTIVSLREFAVKAMNQHFGMQASERFGDAVDHDADGMADELSRGDITALVMFQAELPPPIRAVPSHPDARAAAEKGEGLFSALGCQTCHIPKLPLYSPVFSEPNPFNPAGKLQAFEVDNPYSITLPDGGDASGLETAPDGAIMVPVFTDLKRHDMGETLNNEVLEEEGVPTEEWLTRKLWGFASEPPFLHHGRATLISEAILAHGGEAQESKDAFEALPPEDRDAVVEFLKTLQIPPEEAQANGGQTDSGFGGFGLAAAVGAGALAGAGIAIGAALGIPRVRRALRG